MTRNKLAHLLNAISVIVANDVLTTDDKLDILRRIQNGQKDDKAYAMVLNIIMTFKDCEDWAMSRPFSPLSQ